MDQSTRVLKLLALIPLFSSCTVSESGTFEIPESIDFSSTAPIPLFVGNPYRTSPVMKFPDDPIRYFEAVSSARNTIAGEGCILGEQRLLQVLQEYEDDSSIWFDLATCQAENEAHSDAIDSYLRAISLGTTWYNTSFDGHPPSLEVEIAKQYMLLGRERDAITWIKHALRHRYPSRTFIRDIPEFAELQSSGKYNDLFGNPSADELTRVEKWVEDIQYLARQIHELHIDPDFKTSSSELTAYLNELLDDVPVLSDEQIAAKLLVFMGLLGTGHDFLLQNSGLQWIAAKTYFFSDGLYIIDADEESLVGARIDKFGDRTSKEAFEIVQNSVTRDNNMSPYWNGSRMLLSPSVLEELGVIQSANNITITLTDKSGEDSEIRPPLRDFVSTTPALAENPTGIVPLYLTNLRTPVWFSSISEDTLYVQVTDIYDTSPGEFARVSERVKQQAISGSVTNIVLDLRHSQGGNGTLLTPLIRTLVSFREINDEHRLIILIGRNTFSAAQYFAGQLELYADPIFVGEPTGGRPTFAGTAGSFSLPYSEIQFIVPAEYGLSGWAGDQRSWVAPDIPVTLSSEDYFKGHDPVLETALEFIVSTE